MRIACDIVNIVKDDQPAVQATCSDCGHTECAFGQADVSRRKALVMLRENCPEKARRPSMEGNFYYDEDDSSSGSIYPRRQSTTTEPKQTTPKPWWEK